MQPQYLVILFLLILNLAGFAVMGADKARARRDDWRIPEKTLFLIALLGGSAGCLFGMFFFHHKTRHASFRIGMPCILFFQIVLLSWALPRFFPHAFR
jgi:uncharacterized membrane protein YsdA (DUF1294 family)